MRRWRFRKWAKWAGTVAAVVVLCLAFAGAFCRFSYAAYSADGDSVTGLDVGEGTVMYTHVSDLGLTQVAGRSTAQVSRAEHWRWGFRTEMAAAGMPDLWCGGVMYEVRARERFLGVSFVYLVLVTAIPAALLWYSDRRRSGPHQCRECGYDRRGLAVGVKCPECGTVPDPASK